MVSQRLARVVWWSVTPISVLLIAVSILRMLEVGYDGLLIQGPLVIDPTLADRLATVVDPGLLRVAQIGIHVSGLILFLGLGFLIVFRTQNELSLIASATLIAIGMSLFAPLSLLQGGWARLASIMGEAVPETILNYWFSVAGILLLVFLRLLVTARQGRFDHAVLVLIGAVAVAAAIRPASPFLPSNLPGWSGPVIASSIPMVALTRAWSSRPIRAVRPVLISLTIIALTLVILLLLRPSLQPDAFGLILVTPRLQALYGVNSLALVTAALVALPLSIVLGVVRYRLFDIDLLLNRAMVYGSLTLIATASLALVTLSMSALAGNLIGLGVGEGVTVQVAAAAGVVTGTVFVLASQRLRRRIQAAIDRRFYREKFSAEQALERFSSRIGAVVDRNQLDVELRALLASTLQPVTVDLVRSFSPNPDGIDLPLAGTDQVLRIGPRRAGIPYRGLEIQFLERTAERLAPALRVVDLVETQEASRRQRQRVEEELAVAQRIQRELLPRQLPTIPGLDLEVFYRPAREVGGDFYDFYPLGQTRWGVAIGDVTDKGMPAALVMASCRTVLRGVALSDPTLTPGEVLARANALLVGDIPAGMFITCLYGVFETEASYFQFANAGHNPPVHHCSSDAKLVVARGMPLGLMQDMVYDEATIGLALGETLILTSDGVTESHSLDGEMFGFEGLVNGPSELAGLLAGVERFSQGIEQEDDMTVIRLARPPATILA